MSLVIVLSLFGINKPYYYNQHIHNFGNIGFLGRIHAELAPHVTKFIDNKCYDGRDIRQEILLPYKNKRVLDLCCGTGMSTMNIGVGIDTSHEMLKVARRNNKNAMFYFGNAENYNPNYEVDIVTCMFSFHEMPSYAHKNIIENAINIANKNVIIVDISPTYKPSKTMLSGEPYILDYLSNIQNELSGFEENEYIKNHVTVWKLYK